MRVKLTKKGIERWQRGHPWIYAADVQDQGRGAIKSGDVVEVVDFKGWLLGRAFYSAASKITLRALTHDATSVDPQFFAAKLKAADELRQRLYPGEATYRLVHGEADGLPGLIVDRYGDCLSVQFLVPGTENRKQLFIDLLVAQFKPKAIVNRSDVGVRALEGLQQEKGVIYGELPGKVPYREGEIHFEIDLLNGQKTGTFLDQRENHVLARTYAQGEALDCFSYGGGFALQLAKAAASVTAVEISEAACAQITANAAANGLGHVKALALNAFDFLRDSVDEGRKFDTIVLDPPSFAKNKGAVEAAVRGYKEINLRAMQLLKPGGILISASCTYHVDEERFEEMLVSAASDAKRRVQIIERRGAARDHPVLLSLRETRYLKCFVLRML